MKSLFRSLLSIVLIASIGMLYGCTTIGAQTVTPQQIATNICPVAKTDLQVFQTTFANDAGDKNAQTIAKDIGKAEPAYDALCADLSNVSTANLNAFAQTGLPALADLVNYLPLTAAQKTKISNDFLLAETALGLAGVVESIIKPTGAPAAASTTASPAR